MVIGGEEVRTGDTFESVMPHDKDHVLATVHKGDASHVEQAIKAAGEAWEDWHRTPWEERAADLPASGRAARGPMALDTQRGDDAGPVEDGASGRDRRRLRAHRLLPVQRAVHAPDLRRAADLRAGHVEPDGVPPARRIRLCGHAVQLHGDRREPPRQRGADGQHGRVEARLDRCVLGALPDEALRSGRPAARRDQPRLRIGCRDRRSLRLRAPTSPASTSPGRRRCSSRCGRPSASNIANYRNYPRIVGETGGKDFIVAHPSADAEAVATAIVRGSFEYQGQKCSAASRVFAPSNLWPEIRERVVDQVQLDQDGRRLRLPELHGRSHRRRLVQDAAGRDRGGEGERDKVEVLVGGGYDDSEGYFVEPTVLETTDPNFRTMRDELFGPGGDDLRLPRGKVRRDARADRPGRAVRPDRRGVRARARRCRSRGREAPLRGRQLLRQRQADRCGGRPAAVRRRRGHPARTTRPARCGT